MVDSSHGPNFIPYREYIIYARLDTCSQYRTIIIISFALRTRSDLKILNFPKIRHEKSLCFRCFGGKKADVAAKYIRAAGVYYYLFFFSGEVFEIYASYSYFFFFIGNYLFRVHYHYRTRILW